jgi:hypothetical protein
MKHLILSLGVIALILTSCSDPKEKKVQELKKVTIALHDEVMPRMGEISELTSALKDLREEVKLDTTDSAINQLVIINAQVKQLDDAHEGMMQWMADYEPRYEEEHPLDSAVVYYEEQRSFIERVKLEMEKSIEDAQTFLGEE